MVFLKTQKCKRCQSCLVHSLVVGSFLKWGTVDLLRASVCILLTEDNRVVELVGKEKDCFSVSC